MHQLCPLPRRRRCAFRLLDLGHRVSGLQLRVKDMPRFARSSASLLRGETHGYYRVTNGIRYKKHAQTDQPCIHVQRARCGRPAAERGGTGVCALCLASDLAQGACGGSPGCCSSGLAGTMTSCLCLWLVPLHVHAAACPHPPPVLIRRLCLSVLIRRLSSFTRLALACPCCGAPALTHPEERRGEWWCAST